MVKIVWNDCPNRSADSSNIYSSTVCFYFSFFYIKVVSSSLSILFIYQFFISLFSIFSTQFLIYVCTLFSIRQSLFFYLKLILPKFSSTFHCGSFSYGTLSMTKSKSQLQSQVEFLETFRSRVISQQTFSQF